MGATKLEIVKPGERRTLMEMSAETSALVFMLRKMRVGDVLTYEEMSREIGSDVRQKRHALQSARHRVLMDDSIHTHVQKNVGVVRISDADAARGSLDEQIGRVRSAARKGQRIASRLNMDEVPANERGAVVAKASLLALAEHAAGAKAQKRTMALTDGRAATVPLPKLLESLKE